MTYHDLIDLVCDGSQPKNGFAYLETRLGELSRTDLSNIIIDGGIMPEVFNHDSSEEKLWAKASDILLACSLNHIGFQAEVIGTRGNSADVLAKTTDYALVGDAKTFRLSRTAKNQKDFKITALDNWRKGNQYAVLIAPFLQYPTKSSQIYAQAVDRNVTMLSYTHLKMMLDHYINQDLRPLWETGNRILEKVDSVTMKEQAYNYWSNINDCLCSVLDIDPIQWDQYLQFEMDRTTEIGLEGISFWKNKVEEYKQLTHSEAISRLIKAEKIESKIRAIEKSIQPVKP